MENLLTQTREISAYLSSIRKYKPLTIEQEGVLFDAYYNKGDKSAKDTIIKSNLLFVYSRAKTYTKDPNKVLDYNNEGIMGMMEAFDNFDYTRGVKFFTYAAHYINRNMNSYKIRTAKLIRPTNHAKVGFNVPKIISEFFIKEYRDPSTDEIIEILAERGIIIKDRRDVEGMQISYLSDVYGEDSCVEDSPVFTKATSTTNEYVKTIEDDYTKSRIVGALNCVSQKERYVMESLLGINKPIINEYQLADDMELTVTRVLQLKNSAISKMSKILRKAV